VQLKPRAAVNRKLEHLGLGYINQPVTLRDLLKRPRVEFRDIAELDNRISSFDRAVLEQVSIVVKYDGYIRRQMEQVERAKHLEGTLIPDGFYYESIPGLSNEVKEKLSKIRPLSIGQAARISGITPAAISILQVYLKKWSAS